MRHSVRACAVLYAIFGAVLALQFLFPILFSGEYSSTRGLLDGLIPLALAYGLWTFRPWARIGGLIVSIFLGFVGVAALSLGLGHVMGIKKASGGTIVDWPIFTLLFLASVVVFAAWQWWMLTRRQTVQMFSAKGE
jgi:hypothetical protein